jgi:hypothetical protein
MKSAYEGMIIPYYDVPGLMLNAAGGAVGNPLIVAGGLRLWFEMALAVSDPNKAPLCLCCEATFGRAALPQAFAVLVPFIPDGSGHFSIKGKRKRKGNVLVTGVCADCTERHGLTGLLDVAMAGWRKMMPDAERLVAGSA